jgi:hypothetical protein
MTGLLEIDKDQRCFGSTLLNITNNTSRWEGEIDLRNRLRQSGGSFATMWWSSWKYTIRFYRWGSWKSRQMIYFSTCYNFTMSSTQSNNFGSSWKMCCAGRSQERNIVVDSKVGALNYNRSRSARSPWQSTTSAAMWTVTLRKETSWRRWTLPQSALQG